MSDIKDRELEIWNNLLHHEARRECATDHWAGELIGHAMTLQRMGVIDKDELIEMLEYADAAYSHVVEALAQREWMQLKAEEQLRGKREG